MKILIATAILCFSPVASGEQEQQAGASKSHREECLFLEANPSTENLRNSECSPLRDELQDVRLEMSQTRLELLQMQYAHLVTTITVVLGLITLVVVVTGYLGIKNISQLRGQYEDEVNKLQKLKATVLTLDHISPDSSAKLEGDTTGEESLEELLGRFLTRYSRWVFEPERILNWGSRQHSFESLGAFSREEIERALNSLARAGVAKTIRSESRDSVGYTATPK